MTRPQAAPVCLKVEKAMTSAEINAELVCPLRTPNFPPGAHDYDARRHNLIEAVSKCMISRQEAQAKFSEYHEAQGSHDEVYTDGSKMNKRVGAAAVINRYFQNGETTCLVPRTTSWLSPLWSNTDYWPYAAGVCIVTGMSWWILHSWLVECSLRDNSWDLHSRIPARSGILLSDMM